MNYIRRRHKILEWEAARRKQPKVVPETPKVVIDKSTCPKCLKKIGRGIHFHIRGCRGNVGVN